MSPTAEPGSTFRPDTVAHCQNGVQVVVLDLPLDLARSLLANYPEFPDSCLGIDLPFCLDILEMLINGPDILLEQLGDQRLAQPEGFINEPVHSTRVRPSSVS